MKPFLFIASFLFAATFAGAQHNHFIYLQADNKQPFYVRVNDKLYSSAASGYVILPKLQQGQYSLQIGFPRNEWPQQTIAVTVAGKDQGYLLKNFDGKGWGLFNLQTMDVTMAGAPAQAAAAQATTVKSDEFSNTLADVVNTPSIKQVKKNEPPATESKNEPAPAPIQKTESQPAAAPVAEPVAAIATGNIRQISKAGDEVATVYTYQVSDETGTDTVNVIIANDQQPKPNPSAAIVEPQKQAADVAPASGETKQAAANEPKFIDIDLPKQSEGRSTVKDAGDAPKPISASSPLKMVNSDCKSMATEDDFLKVRKKMTGEKSDDGMIEASKKFFKKKCYSTEQVKNLSVLFLSDEGKYKFFDAAYPFVYDSGEFKQLESELKDDYYINRFRTLVRR